MNKIENEPKSLINLESRDGKLTLRQFEIKDAEEIFQLINESEKSKAHLSQYGDKTVAKYTTLEDVIESIAHPSNPKRLRLGIRSKEDAEELIGSINLTPQLDNPRKGEIGYYLGFRFSGKKRNYIERSVEALVEMAFLSGNYDELFADVIVGNTASARILDKCGFELTDRNKDKSDLIHLIFTKKRQTNTYP